MARKNAAAQSTSARSGERRKWGEIRWAALGACNAVESCRMPPLRLAAMRARSGIKFCVVH